MASSSVPVVPEPGMGEAATRTLVIVPDGASAAGRAGDTVLVLDTAWTPHGDIAPPGAAAGAAAAPLVVAVRDIAEHVLGERDLIAETSDRLDRWAAHSGVVSGLTIDTTSFWYYVRLRHWMWLQERILWTLIVDEAVRRRAPRTIVAAPGLDAALMDVLPLIAARDGISVVRERAPEHLSEAPMSAGAGRPAKAGPVRGLARGVRRGVRRLLGSPPPPDPVEVRRDEVRRRLDRLAAEPPRLLVVRQHDQQRVDTVDGPRLMDPYLDPILDRLRGTALDPIPLDTRALVKRDDDWASLMEPGAERELPIDALTIGQEELRDADLGWTPVPVDVPLVGVDLGPLLAADVVDSAREWMPRMERSVVRIEQLLRRLRPAGILLADEYHRQDWLAAARRAGVRVAAVQHGMIYPRHNGYMHATRPPQLHLVDRTYVFGRWERDLLVTRSVYHPDEVVVGGSARLDLVRDDPAAAAALRAELGVGPRDRLVLVSGTWGRIYRRFHYPIALARIVDRQLPGVHIVVKHHPGERDDGPYDAIIAGSAAAGGFEAPPVTHVRSVDLYRMLAASDAHLGIHSTVLTEAVVTRTRNLLADQLHSADLLGYVEAGVAIPVRDGADLLRAIDTGATPESEERAAAFVAQHFEPGPAAERIADDLLAWLVGAVA